MAAYGRGGPFMHRHGPAYRFFTSGSNTSLASIDEFDRSRSQPSSHWPRGACRPTVTVPVLPCGISRVRMRSSGLQPGCTEPQQVLEF
jgi:hypothetical protein